MLPRGGQLKCWYREMRTFKVGDNVPDLNFDDYVVLLREGGYVMVSSVGGGWGIITKIVENYGRKFYTTKDFPEVICIDKWGNVVQSMDTLVGEFQGIMGMDDPYFWEKR